jgi:tight adherence protein C
MGDLTIPSLVFVAVTALGGAVLVGRGARRARLRDRFDKAEERATRARADHSPGLVVRILKRVAQMLSIGRPSLRLREELTKAGYHSGGAGSVYLGIKTAVFVVGVAGLAALLLPLETPMAINIVLILGGAAMLSFLPNVVVHLRRAKRAEDIRRRLPDALDLLEVCVSSGMGLDAAWNSVADKVRGVSTTLADEMALTNLELHLGSSRATAMRRMAERTGVEEVSSLVAVLIQSERFGTSISDALRTYASSMRERRSLQAQEAAEKMAVKILIPMVLFIFPAAFVVTVGPACITIVHLLGNG